MTAARFIEQRITRDLLRRREVEPALHEGRLAQRLITVLAATAGLPDRPSSSQANASEEAPQPRPLPSFPPPSPFQEWQ